MIVKHIKTLLHNGSLWHIVHINGSYFSRLDASDTGPYSTVEQAEEFIRMIPQPRRRMK